MPENDEPTNDIDEQPPVAPEENEGGDDETLAPNGQPWATNNKGEPLGYPKNTSVKDMEFSEQAAYWKHMSRFHENRNKGATNQSEPNPELEAALQRVAELEQSQLTGEQQAQQAAIDEAVSAAVAEVTANFQERLITEQLKGYAGIRLKDDDRVTEFIESINQSKFVGEDGNVDATKVQAYFDKVHGPVGDDPEQPEPRTPAGAVYPDVGQTRQRRPPKTDHAALGRQMAERRGHIQPKSD